MIPLDLPMITRAFSSGVLALVTACGASHGAKAVDTPESAVARLEAAYRAKDIEAAVAAKDFVAEARLMLRKLDREKTATKDFSADPEVLDKTATKDFSADPEVLDKTAEILEITFRKYIEKDGFPEFADLRCSFEPHERVDDDLVIVHEICIFPDGGSSRQRLYVAKSSRGWRVLNPID